MAEILTNNKNYYDIANTIRQMKNVNTTYKPRQMASALKDIYSNEVEGVPPLTFESNGMPLIDYRIDGASGGVGDRTENLFDESYPDIVGSTIKYLTLSVENGSYTLSTNAPVNDDDGYACLFFLSGNVISGVTTPLYGVWAGHNKTVTTNDNYITIGYRIYKGINPLDYQTMLNVGSTALPYEPYGYKVPVVISGKNLLQNTASSQTIDGVTITVNEDGSVTCTGTAEKTISYYINSNVALESGTYRLTGCPAGGSDSNYFKMDILQGTQWVAVDTGNGSNFTIDNDFVNVTRLVIYKDYQCDNLKFYPMIRKADIADNTYEPYYETTTTNIYLDEPIEENESISLSETNVDIPTIEGTNVLTIDTTVQPNNMYIQAPKDSLEAIQIANRLEEI